MPQFPKINLPNIPNLGVGEKFQNLKEKVPQVEKITQSIQWVQSTRIVNQAKSLKDKAGTTVIKQAIVNLWEETFPTKDIGIKRYEKKIVQTQRDEFEENTEIKEEIVEEWKKNALQVVENKETKWEKIKKQFSESTLGSKIRHKQQEFKDKIMEDQVTKELRDGIHDIKENIKDNVQENPLMGQIKSKLDSVLAETTEAKAVKKLQEIDPDFDLYRVEEEISDVVSGLYELVLMKEGERLEYILEGPAKIYWRELFQNHVKEIQMLVSVSDITPPIFLGANLEDKSSPRLTFSLTVAEKYKTVNTRSSYARNGYYLTCVRHPEPDLAFYGHPWMVVDFMPADDYLKIR